MGIQAPKGESHWKRTMSPVQTTYNKLVEFKKELESNEGSEDESSPDATSDDSSCKKGHRNCIKN